MSELVRHWTEEGGLLRRLRLHAPPRNVIGASVVDELAAALAAIPEDVVAVLVDAEGEHFSYGSSIEEHRPDQIRGALPRFHALCRRLVDAPVPIVFAINGYCLGGGLELVLCGDVAFATPRAMLGLPEPAIGCFAPVGSLLLREWTGEARARELLLSGRLVTAKEARELGLVHEVAEDAEGAARQWLQEHVLGQSPSSIRLGVRAARLRFREEFFRSLDAIEKLYLDELVPTADCAEGVAAFLEKRQPKWVADRRRKP